MRMKKSQIVILCAFGLAAAVWGDTTMSHSGLFANAKEVFPPLLADPREIQLGLRMVTPVSRTAQGEVLAGDYFGLYRWELPWQESYLQWSVAGGIFSRFDLVSMQKDNEVLDYSANMPIDVRIGKWSTRFLPYHISSHLGDDFIKRTGILPLKYTFDSFKWLFAYEPAKGVRLYSGFNYILRNRYTDLGRNAVQTGTEWTSGWWGHDHAQLYWANDFQTWQRVGWNPTIASQVGVHLANKPQDIEKLTLYIEYGAGHMAFGQLFQQEESHWVLGLRFDIP
jgi:hypothetical protein